MLIPLKYTYLIGATISLVIWLILYWHRKDLRREMITMGILVTIAGIFAEYLWWTKDWWRPLTITGTQIGIEDILLGFTNGGIAAILYEELFKKRMYKYKSSNHNMGVILLIMTSYFVFIVLFYILRLNSFIATTAIQIIIGGIIVIMRKDLIYDALLTGVCMVIAVMPFYILLEYLSPNFLEGTWLWSNLSGVSFMKIPIEDLVFYFLTGFSIAPFYLYWKSERLRKISVSK